MLRIIQKDNLLYMTENERSEYDLDTTQLLYTFPDLSYNENIKDKCRPFKALWEKKRELYKLSLIDFLPDILYTDYQPILTSQEEHNRIIREVEKIASFMELRVTQIPEYDIKYECDTWNSVEDAYGIDLVSMFKGFLILSAADQELVRKVWLSRENLRFEIAKLGNWINILDYLPSPVRTELMIFGESSGIVGKEGSVLEFKRKEQIGPKLPDLKESIYQEFKLGEFFLEGAQEVKDRLEKVYLMCGIDRNPKAKDLEDWFIIVPCRSNGKRGFRIDLRK